VAPIIEGQGEEQSIRNLLQRIGLDLLSGMYIEVVRPIRNPSGSLRKPDGLQKAVHLARKLLAENPASSEVELILVLIDSDGECPAELGPRLLGWAKDVDPRIDVACVVVHLEYETWFVAAAESLTQYLKLGAGEPIPDDPETQRCKKAWIQQRFRRPKYQEPRDQPAMTAAMDLVRCRSRSGSFDKLCRELERRAQ
jgi:hypothetical protein